MIKIKEDILKREWFLLEKLHQYPPICLEPPVLAMTTDLSDWGLTNVPHSIMEYTNGNVNMYYLKHEWQDAAENNLQAIVENPSIMDKAHKRSDKVCELIVDLSKEIIDVDLSKKSSKDLTKLYERALSLEKELHTLRVIAWQMETGGEVFSKYLVNYLANIVKENKIDTDPVLIFSDLVTPTESTLVNQEHLDLLKLAKKVKEKKIELSTENKEIKEHTKKYNFLPYGCEGPLWSDQDIINHIQGILNENQNIDKLINHHEKQFDKIKEKQKQWIKEIPLDKKHQHLIQVAKDIVFQKGFSKEHQYLVWYSLSVLLKEVAKRNYITLKQVRYFLPAEVPEAIQGKEFDPNELNERYKYSLIYIDASGSYFLTKKDARDIKNKMNIISEDFQIDEDTTELKGQTAVPGQARGEVVIINSPKEQEKMKAGNILVSEMTIPEIVTSMKKASAIVTDMGGITCHAAIVSRELGIPCIIGTKIATKFLKDGDTVEVDATKGIVKKIK